MHSVPNSHSIYFNTYSFKISKFAGLPAVASSGRVGSGQQQQQQLQQQQRGLKIVFEIEQINVHVVIYLIQMIQPNIYLV